MNCPYCDKNIYANCYEKQHRFVYYNDNSWWLIINNFDYGLEFRFEIHNNIPPTMYVFSLSPKNVFDIFFQMPAPFDKNNLKEIADKYVNNFLKLKAFI